MSWRASDSALRVAIGASLILHAAAFASYVAKAPQRRLDRARPLNVSLVSLPAPVAATPVAEVAARRERTVRHQQQTRPLAQGPQATQSDPAPAPSAAMSTPAAPAPEKQAAATQLPQSAAATTAAPAALTAPSVPELIAPRFDAGYLDNPAPPYPAMAKRQGEQGRVLLRVLVNPGGNAEQVEVRDSSGFARLDEVARDTVRRWRFIPARRGADPVPAWVLVPVSFQLQG